MAVMSVKLRSITDTQAAIGWAGGHSVVIDRPEGRAGGMGLGFNGGQMIALAIGGCFCNDLRYVAETMDVAIAAIAVDVDIDSGSRIHISPELRRDAGLIRDVLLIGMGPHLELWDTARYAAHEAVVKQSPMPEAIKSFVF